MMNKKLIKLVQISGVDDDMFPITDFENQELEQFANLIIKKCVKIISKRKNKTIKIKDDPWNVDEAMSMAETDIKKYFGLE